MASTLTEAIHLVSSDSAAGHVKQVVKRVGVPGHIRIMSERLTTGPCDVDPERHVELRRAWNAEQPGGSDGAFGLDELRAAVAGDLPVVVWATRAYADLVWLWWILDGLVRLGSLAQPPILVRPNPDDPLSTVGGMTPEEGLAALADAHSLRDDELREEAELWGCTRRRCHSLSTQRAGEVLWYSPSSVKAPSFTAAGSRGSKAAIFAWPSTTSAC